MRVMQLVKDLVENAVRAQVHAEAGGGALLRETETAERAYGQRL